MAYRVFKFGGASVKDAAAVVNMADIIAKYAETHGVLIVVSAMGKTTNALERLLFAAQNDPEQIDVVHQEISEYHLNIVDELFLNESTLIRPQINLYLEHLKVKLQAGITAYTEDQLYDQIVSFGELISSRIVYEYLIRKELPIRLIEARNYIRTHEEWRDAKVDKDISYTLIKNDLPLWLERGLVLTQGFIGGTTSGYLTTLGREGSDYSAALFAAALDAESVTIWKDVPGVMNADPRRVADAKLFSELSYKEAAEMTFYGASVIHPKTIKPLASKSIPLYVRSFIAPESDGTKIHQNAPDQEYPALIFKDNQTFVTCSVRDISFVGEGGIGTIFSILDTLGIRINLMQRSAISFSFAMDFKEDKLKLLCAHLNQTFEVSVIHGLTLLTIKNYSDHILQQHTNGKKIIIEQMNAKTAQVLMY